MRIGWGDIGGGGGFLGCGGEGGSRRIEWEVLADAFIAKVDTLKMQDWRWTW